MSEERRTSTEPEPVGEYEAPAIVWEEELPQGPGLFSACGKIGGTSGPCNINNQS
jgi:hypothetical protein